MTDYKTENEIFLSKDSRHAIKDKIARTHKTVREMFDNSNGPEGFAWETVYRIIETEGMQVSKEYFEYIHSVLNMHKKSGAGALVTIDKNFLDRIQSEVDRTGLSLHYLFKKDVRKKSNGVCWYTAKNWFNETSKYANWYYASFVLDKYSTCPDKKNITKQKYEDIRLASLEPIPIKDMNQLKYFRDEYGFLPSKVLQLSHDAPNGLSSQIISGWLNNRIEKADPEMVAWVLKRCREMQKVKP